MAAGATERLEEVRSFYARLAAAGGGGALREDMERAFHLVPREHFLGTGPWHAVAIASGTYVQTPSDDPVHVYQNLMFALDRSKRIHNGEPFLHAQMLGGLAPARDESAVHVGCGTGYYTAILALLVGAAGRVTAYEIEPHLAERAEHCLAPWENVEVRTASATQEALPPADLIYVSAGATRPPGVWLDALNDGGRLVFPLSSSQGGVTLKVTRQGAAFGAEVIGNAWFIACAGAHDPAEASQVARALRTGALLRTRSLRRGSAPDDSAVLVGTGWWLSSEPDLEA